MLLGRRDDHQRCPDRCHRQRDKRHQRRRQRRPLQRLRQLIDGDTKNRKAPFFGGALFCVGGQMTAASGSGRGYGSLGLAWGSMSIAFGGIVAFLFRGMNLVVALGLVVLCSRQLSEGDYGTFVLGLTIVGVVSAATGGLTAATGYQVSSKKRPTGTAMANGGVLGLGLGALAVVAGIAVGALLTGEAHREALAVGFACAAVIIASVVAGTFLGRESFI